MSDTLQTIVLVVATLSTGLMAGVFGLYANSIMPGLRTTDDRTFVAAFQALDRAIVNPVFLIFGFVGALVFDAVAMLVHLGDSSVLPWTIAALGLYVVTVVITGTVHIPRNDAIKAAGAPDAIPDMAAVRRRFDEARWHRWNIVRTITTIVAFGCLCGALAA